jgi:hypothetical protein
VSGVHSAVVTWVVILHGGIEYIHHSPASRKRRQKGNPVPGVYLGHPVPGGYKYRDLALQVGGLKNWNDKIRSSPAGLRPERDYTYEDQQQQ